MIIIYIIIIICSCQGNIYKQIRLSQKRGRKRFRLCHNCVCTLYSDLNHPVLGRFKCFRAEWGAFLGDLWGTGGCFGVKWGAVPQKFVKSIQYHGLISRYIWREILLNPLQKRTIYIIILSSGAKVERKGLKVHNAPKKN